MNLLIIRVTKHGSWLTQRSNDSDEELQEAPTKRPKLDCGSNSVKKFGGASTYKSKFAFLQTAKRATMEYNNFAST